MSPNFILTPGIWIGEGKITISTSPEFIKFYTKWQISEASAGIIKAVQKVEMQGVNEQVVNQFTFENLTSTSFSVSLENDLLGTVFGKGVINDKMIAWEFRDPLVLEGFEVYEMQENGDYSFHAEYSSTDQYRTTVDGLIWNKS